jgi:CHAD domain-containing protein
VVSAKTTAKDAYPIQSLRDHATEMEAAILMCMAEATPRVVHKLRTESRRIEAYLDLLGSMKDLPPYRAKAAKALRQLHKVRKAAGVVRDLDVQQRLIDDHLPEDSLAAREDADALHQVRLKARKHAARDLQEVLAKRKRKIARRLEKLIMALEPAMELHIPPAKLLRLSKKEFDATHALIIRNPTSEHLHGIRKAAKVARYQAELAGSEQAKVVAKRFKGLQEAGGHWHDWMDLAAQAREELGEGHPTTEHFEKVCEGHLGEFRKLVDRARKAKAS